MNMKQKKLKVLITGANGMLGSDVCPIIAEKHEIFPTDIDNLDIRDKKAIEKWIEKANPDWIIHMAAMTDLDYCEDVPELAYEVNYKGTENLAKACAEKEKKFIYFSTSGIFSGKKKQPYTEHDIPIPQNIYGKSKYKGEQAVLECMPESDVLILRAGWLFGGGVEDKKFVGKIYKLAHKLSQLKAVDDILGSPNYTVDIGKLILYLLENNIRGIYHVANKGYATRYDIAREIARLAEVDCEVIPVAASEFPTKAKRPPMEAINNTRLKSLGYELRPWEQALKDYILRLKCELPY